MPIAPDGDHWNDRLASRSPASSSPRAWNELRSVTGDRGSRHAPASAIFALPDSSRDVIPPNVSLSRRVEGNRVMDSTATVWPAREA